METPSQVWWGRRRLLLQLLPGCGGAARRPRCGRRCARGRRGAGAQGATEAGGAQAEGQGQGWIAQGQGQGECGQTQGAAATCLEVFAHVGDFGRWSHDSGNYIRCGVELIEFGWFSAGCVHRERLSLCSSETQNNFEANKSIEKHAKYMEDIIYTYIQYIHIYIYIIHIYIYICFPSHLMRSHDPTLGF